MRPLGEDFDDHPNAVDYEGPRVVHVRNGDPPPLTETYRSGLNWRELERRRRLQRLGRIRIWALLLIFAAVAAVFWLGGR